MTDTPTLDTIETEPDLPYVVIRTYSAGVHVGYLKCLDENTQTVELINTRRLLKWTGALTLSEVSKNGIASNSRLSEEIERIILLESIEVIYATDKAKNILRTFKND